MKSIELKPIIERLLNIEKVRVKEVEIDEKGNVIIKVVSLEEGTKCKNCGIEIKEEIGEDEAIRLTFRKQKSSFGNYEMTKRK